VQWSQGLRVPGSQGQLPAVDGCPSHWRGYQGQCNGVANHFFMLSGRYDTYGTFRMDKMVIRMLTQDAGCCHAVTQGYGDVTLPTLGGLCVPLHRPRPTNKILNDTGRHDMTQQRETTSEKGVWFSVLLTCVKLLFSPFSALLHLLHIPRGRQASPELAFSRFRSVSTIYGVDVLFLIALRVACQFCVSLSHQFHRDGRTGRVPQYCHIERESWKLKLASGQLGKGRGVNVAAAVLFWCCVG
jgi:hypothetical protein